MFSVLKALSNASSKIVATFIVAIFLILLSIMFYPQAYLAMDDFANWLANLDFMRNPTDNKQGTAVVRVLINEATIFGVVTTLVARMIVELVWLGCIALWRMVNPPEDKPAEASSDGAKAYY